VMQLVNSSYFGMPRQTTSIREAVSYLGIELISSLALMTGMLGQLDGFAFLESFLSDLQEHSVLTAKLAQSFAHPQKHQGLAYVGGMVHDIGKIVLALNNAEKFLAAQQTAKDTARPCQDMERETWGVTHAQAGAFLLGVWGLPLEIVDIAAFHESPSLNADCPLEPLAAVHAANAFVRAYESDAADPREFGDIAFLQRAGYLDRWADLESQAASLLPAASVNSCQ
jgi:putative nucleotidyltransferase with HDIG domain